MHISHSVRRPQLPQAASSQPELFGSQETPESEKALAHCGPVTQPLVSVEM